MSQQQPDSDLRPSASASFLRLTVSYHGSDVQGSDFGLAVIVGEHNEATPLRIDRSVIGCGDDIFSAVARSNGEGNEWCRVQEFSNAGNHDEDAIVELSSLQDFHAIHGRRRA